VELTGITDQIIAEKGRPLAGVYEQLSKIHKNQGCFINPVVWGGGDSVYLHDQSGSKEPNFFGYRIIDVKTIYQAIMVSKGLALKGGLVSSMSKMGVDFIGTPHNAYYDALNTARFYLHILKKLGSI
jgi:inhibitor of KinA sporulation pathway (predicted exonuclease)